MSDIDPLSQQLGVIQGTLESIQREQTNAREDMDRRFREVWARIGQIERAAPMNGWKGKTITGGATGGLLLAIHFLAKFLGYEI